MGIVAAGIAPHPPIIIPEIGRGEEKKAGRTIEALQVFARRLAEVQGDTVVIITPHGPMFRNAMAILAEACLEGDFAHFLVPDVRLQAENDLELVRTIERERLKIGVEVALLAKVWSVVPPEEVCLDHGITVPLLFEKAGTGGRCVAVTYALLPYAELHLFGQILKKRGGKPAAEVVVVASRRSVAPAHQGCPGRF